VLLSRSIRAEIDRIKKTESLTMEVQLITLNTISLSFNPEKAQGLYRESYIGGIENLIKEGASTVIVDGDTGIGKTTVLSQFARKHQFDCISYFANKLDKFSFSSDYITEDIGRQLHFVLKNVQPTDDQKFNINQINSMKLDLARALRKRKKLFIALDGLDQFSPSEFEQIKPMLDALPWDNPNAVIIVSGDSKKLINLYPTGINQKAEILRVLQFTFEESRLFFTGTIASIEQIREIHDTWRGNPERLSDIMRIISKGTSVENFLREDATEKNRLLEIEWKKSSNIIHEEWQYNALAIVCFDSTATSINKIGGMLDIKPSVLIGLFNTISYLRIDNDNVSFITVSLKDFVSKKLKNYENAAHEHLVKFYTGNIDQDAISSLTSYYEKKKSWSETISLLTVDNLSKIINNSNSFGDIKRQIAVGYRASVNHKELSGSETDFENVFKFSLYRSIFLELQASDTREAEIQSCVALKDYGKALSLATNAFLKEDRFKMLIIYAKECKVRNVKIDQVVLDEISSQYKAIDIDYIKENVVDIAIKLAYVLPKLAIELIEKASEGGKRKPSLEWLLTYLSVATDEVTSKSAEAVQDVQKDNGKGNILDLFFSSVGYRNELITADEIKSDISKFTNLSDRLYLTRAWIRHNEKSESIFDIMNLGLNLVLEDSSTNKPSTSTLFDISYPLAKADKAKEIRLYISRIDSLVATVNTPTIDLIRLQLVIIEAELKINLGVGNQRLYKLVEYIRSTDDATTRVEAYALCWSLLEEMYAIGFQVEEVIYHSGEAQKDLNAEIDVILSGTAFQHRELKGAIAVIARFNLAFTISIAERVNTLFRRNWCYITMIESYVSNPMNEWDMSTIGKVFRAVTDSDTSERLMLDVVDAAYSQIDNKIDGRHNFIKSVGNIRRIENNEAKCSMLIKSIAVLSSNKETKTGLIKNYGNLIEQMKEYLLQCWSKIDNPWVRVSAAYRMSSIIADYDGALANQYYLLAKQNEEALFADNITYTGVFISTLHVAIKTYVGLLKAGVKEDYSAIEYLIEKINSPLDQVALWAKFAVKAHFADANDICAKIVSEKIMPVVGAYINESKEAYHLNALIMMSASAIYLAQRAQLLLLLSKLPQREKDATINSIVYVVLSKVYHDEAFDSTKGYSNVDFQDISDIAQLLNQVDDDIKIYSLFDKLSQIIKENPSLLTREHKNALKPALEDVLRSRLPNNKSGIQHEGYLILCEACLTQFDTGVTDAEYNKVFSSLKERAEKISNLSDRAFIFDALTSECSSSKAKKLRQELLLLGFAAADQIPSNREKFDRYIGLLDTAKDVSDSIFLSKIKEINQEIFAIDNKDLFKTHRKLIDLAFKHDKALAERLISVLDTDPGRKAMTFPAEKYLEDIKLENEALEDYDKFKRLKSRRQIQSVAWRNLGQLNSGSRMAKSIEQSNMLLPIAAKTSFYYSIPVFDLFIANTLRKLGSGSKNKLTIASMHAAALASSQLTYDIVRSLSSKKTYVPTNFSIKSSDTSFTVRPGQRQAAIDFIVNYLSDAEYDELYVIDSYASEKDVRFLRALVECSPQAHITLMTSLEGNKGQVSIDLPAFIHEWKSISADPLPNMTVIRVNKADRSSPFHDRYILSKKAGLGLKVGSSINSIGGGKVFGITVMNQTEIDSVYESTVEPFANQKVRIYGKDTLKYEYFDL
jgi:hypothetical protein